MFDSFKLRRNRIYKFKPKVQIYSERGAFILKTISDSEELIEALKLRYQVFHRELLGKSKSRGVDVDEFDFICDHLAIIDKKSGQIVGTYRLNSSLNAGPFYSSQEFNLRRLIETDGTKLELGRACIHKDFRKGLVIALLWRGIAEYMAATRAELLFGCASIKTESPRQAALLYHYFRSQGRFQTDYSCPPMLRYSMPKLDLWIENLNRDLTPEELSEVQALIPPLARAYLNAGAFLGGEPAYDPEFKCIDFLTILPRENLNKVLWRKFGTCETTVNDSENSKPTKIAHMTAPQAAMMSAPETEVTAQAL